MNQLSTIQKFTAILVVLLAILSPAGVWADTLTCTLIDSDFPGASSTHAYGINNAGDIVGIVDDATGRHGYKKSGSTIIAIRHPGGTTYVNGINDLDQIVGFVQNPGNHGFLTTDGVVFTPINDPNAQEPNGTIPFAINNSGQIVGLFVSVSGSNFSHGFLTNDGVAFTTIDVPTANSTAAYGINDAGVVVGQADTHAFLRAVNGAFTIFDFPAAGVTQTLSTDTNNNGQIIGFFVDATGVHGFLKDGTTFTALDCQGAVNTFIYGINDTGQIVGDYFDGVRDHGFIATLPPLIIEVQIDIKPGSFPNSIDPKSKGKIPVAILTTDSFDATTVDTSTVLFGATGMEAAPVHVALEDVDGDGDTDLILHFNTQETGIVCGDTSALLTGESVSGQEIEGSDSIKTVGCK